MVLGELDGRWTDYISETIRKLLEGLLYEIVPPRICQRSPTTSVLFWHPSFLLPVKLRINSTIMLITVILL